jgi:type I restriction enzyme M protein
MNLALHGLHADLGAAEADTFHSDLHESRRVDYVLANPPFNISDWGVDSLLADVRWKYGVPPSSNANLAWVQHILWHLNEGGRAGIVLANGSLTSDQPAERAIRRGLIEDDVIACMVALPGQLFYSTTIPVTLWFIDRAKPARCRGSVLFIDAKDTGKKVTRTHRVLTDDDITRIAGIYHQWRHYGELQTDDAGFATSLELPVISANDYSLSPSRYVTSGPAGHAQELADVGDLRDQFAALVAEARQLDELILGEAQQ